MDQAGFDSMEFFLSLRFKKFVREHREDPWDWLRLGTKEIKNTRLRYHGGLHSGFEFIPDCVRRLVIQTVVKYGVTLTRTSNAWNNYKLLGNEAAELKKLGMETVMNLIYSISPRHTDEYYAQRRATRRRSNRTGFASKTSAVCSHRSARGRWCA
jgi:oxaloacetate decarboxylase alpha subunit